MANQYNKDQLLKVGLLVDDEVVSKEVYDLVKLSLRSNKYIITSIVIQKIDNDQNILKKIIKYIKSRGLRKLIENSVFAIITKLERIFLFQIKKYRDFLKMYDLNEFNIKSILIKPLVSKSGVVFRYSNEDIEKIKNENLDILIRCGSGIQRGKFLIFLPLGLFHFIMLITI